MRFSHFSRGFILIQFYLWLFGWGIGIRTLVKYNAFRLKGEKLHQHFFTIHYHLLPNRQVSKEKSEK